MPLATMAMPRQTGMSPLNWVERYFETLPGFADAGSDRVKSTKGPAADRQDTAQSRAEELEGHDAESHLANQRFLFRCKRTEPGRQFLDAHRHGLEVRRKRHR